MSKSELLYFILEQSVFFALVLFALCCMLYAFAFDLRVERKIFVFFFEVSNFEITFEFPLFQSPFVVVIHLLLWNAACFVWMKIYAKKRSSSHRTQTYAIARITNSPCVLNAEQVSTVHSRRCARKNSIESNFSIEMERTKQKTSTIWNERNQQQMSMHQYFCRKEACKSKHTIPDTRHLFAKKRKKKRSEQN